MLGVHADLGENAPRLEVGKAVLVGRALAADQLVRLLLRGSERVASGGLATGGDHRVVGVVVQADEAEVRQGAEAGLPQVGGDLVVPGGGDLTGAPWSGCGDPDQVAPLVGQGEKEQAVGLVLAGVVRPVLVPGASAGADLWGSNIRFGSGLRVLAGVSWRSDIR